jgi:integrase
MIRASGESSIYRGADGRWHGRVSMGVGHDGRRVRRHVTGQSRNDVVRKVRELERARDTGQVSQADRWTVEQWLTYWLDNVVGPFVKVNTLAGYRVAVHEHLIPGIGKHRLDTLRPEHLERLYVDMLRKTTKRGTSLKPGTVHHAHRTLRAALNEAVRRDFMTKNPALIARRPTVEELEVEPFSVEEIQRLFRTALTARNGARWVIALALGLRQGEALGLKWEDVNLEAQTMAIRRGRLRPKYEHGCGGTCGRMYAGYCPDRRAVREETNSPKSRSSRRHIGLPAALAVLLEQHREAQGMERRQAGSLWQEGDWIFADEIGRPLNPRTDWGPLEATPEVSRRA